MQRMQKFKSYTNNTSLDSKIGNYALFLLAATIGHKEGGCGIFNGLPVIACSVGLSSVHDKS